MKVNIRGAENYVVTDSGNVINEATGKRLKRYYKNGYAYVGICRGGKKKHRSIHSLVAEAFLGDRPNGCFVDHIDRNKKNNKVSNLRYVTRRENAMNRNISDRDTPFGVDFHKGSGLWRAKCREGGRRHEIGYYKTKEEAGQAYLDFIGGLANPLRGDG